MIFAPLASTAERVVLFGKNSDRQRNEAQAVELFPSADHAPDERLSCTYLSILQARRTHAVLLCRPFWIWGAEMGANEHGLVIGNEAVFARSEPSEQDGLIGMDLVRLGLERAATAAEAVQVMTDLLERYGAGGNCGHRTPAYYNNSFLIADSGEAFILETVDREWLVERVSGVRSISNAYSISTHVERISAGLPHLIREREWSRDATPNYAAVLADPHREHLGNAGARSERSVALLRALEGKLGARDMMRILRDHGTDQNWHPKAQALRTLCMHAKTEEQSGQTTGALVSELRKGRGVHWVTATAAPCTAIFKPVLMDVPLPSHGSTPTDRFDSNALWWQHERLHRAALQGDFSKFLDDIRLERDALEEDFGSRIKTVLDGASIVERSRVVADCWREAIEMEARWLERLMKIRPDDTPYQESWLKMSRLADMN